MRIGIDARPLAIKLTGVGKSLQQTIKALSKIDGENEYFLYSNRDFPMPVENGRWHKCVDQGLFTVNGTLWVATRLHKMLIRDGIDVLWGPMQIAPLSKVCKTVIMVYDFVWSFFPETMSLPNLIISRLFIPRSIRRADRIACISEATACDLAHLFVGNASKTEVVHLAAGDYSPLKKEEGERYIARKYGVQSRYILNVGTIEPRKNLSCLLQAFNLLRSRHGVDYCLLIVGSSGWRNSNIYNTYRECGFTENEVKFLGYVSDMDMPYLYAGAELFVFPSLYEGFGLPPLEAMACGCPVITSNVSSLPEVVGDAGLMVSPDDIEGLAQTMGRVLKDEYLRQQMSLKGLERARQFSWEKTAHRMLDMFSSVAR
ncbi:MAG: glycosyltransferase family 1 protein [bacterium]|nr:glycosyltransferase family 1 protein [bacterium]